MFAAFDNTYARLPQGFWAKADPASAPQPSLLRLNRALAAGLGLNFAEFTQSGLAGLFTGGAMPEGASPVAMAYAGHQFGNFVPSLGDGRALLMGEVVDANATRWDIHMKGTGRTVYSRGADGRSPLGAAIREYIVSEAMHRLGVPTTRSLAVAATGETVAREQPLPGGVLTRVARSHVRVGTFQYFAARGDIESVKILADHVIARLYPDIADDERPYLRLLEAVISKQGRLIAKWMALGFVHGVMNTDNMTVSGETIDYGPCAFLEEYDPAAVFSSIDVYGRYAYGNQPAIAQWNLTRFAECLVPLIDHDQRRAVELAQAAVEAFGGEYSARSFSAFAAKLGLDEKDGRTEELVMGLLEMMAVEKADFTLAFRAVFYAYEGDPAPLQCILGGNARWKKWHEAWKSACRPHSDESAAAVRLANPLYIPRNHLVETAISHANSGDYAAFEQLMEALADPFTERRGLERFAEPATDSERVTQTFCGT